MAHPLWPCLISVMLCEAPPAICVALCGLPCLCLCASSALLMFFSASDWKAILSLYRFMLIHSISVRFPDLFMSSNFTNNPRSLVF